MNKTLRRSLIPAAVLAAALTGGLTLSHAQTSKPTLPSPRSGFMAQTDPYGRSSDSRELRNVIEDLENCPSEDISSGRIGRYFTDPAVIVTNGRAHHINWQQIQSGRSLDREPTDRNDDSIRRNPDDRDNGSLRRNPVDQPDRPNSDVQIEDFQTRRIDARTVVVLYTAIIPDGDNVIHQPVVATLVREYSDSPWRVATYTAENAAIPGSSSLTPDDNYRSRLQ